jgi:ribosomal protein L7/L12
MKISLALAEVHDLIREKYSLSSDSDVEIIGIAPMNASMFPITDLMKGLVASNNSINAIKTYREVYKTGLKDAKDAIDRYRASINQIIS